MTTGVTPATTPTATPTTGAPASAGTEASNPNAQLGQNAFLKLMVAQLQQQDPLQPSGNDTEYVSELASFTELEQMTNLANAGELTGALQMMGHTVTYTNAKGETQKGAVESVQSGHEGPTLTIAGVPGISEASIKEVS